MAGHLLCLGYGYTARVLGARWLRSDRPVTGTRRSPPFAADGSRGIVFSETRVDEAASALREATHLLVSIPPGDDGDPVLNALEDEIKSCDHLQWVGYLSTTGVYGDTAGAWVDEWMVPAPTQERSRRRLEAENGWRLLHLDHGLPVHVFRLAGIYGPGRSVLDRVRDGRARRVRRPGHVFSRIHVADIATVLEASMARPDPGAIYNVSDDEPAEPCAVVEYACTLLGVAPPPMIPFERADLSPMARSFWADHRRISNDRIKKDLEVTLAHPDYRTGLQSDFESGYRPETWNEHRAT